MKRTWIMALALLWAPGSVAGQVELGVDFFGIDYYDEDGASDAAIGVSLPVSGMRVGFPAGSNIIIETRLEFDWFKQGDGSARDLTLIPGLNYLINEQIYLRGEAGLSNFSFDPGTGSSISGTQYIFGGGVGTRRSFGMGILRLEGGVQIGTENADDGIASYTNIYGSAGVSVTVN